MRNPFARPRTPEQWLLGSVGWTVLGVAGWWAAVAATPSLYDENIVVGAQLGTLVQALLWGLAVPGGRALLAAEQRRWPAVLGWCWWGLLHLALLLALGLTLLTWLLIAAFHDGKFLDFH